MGYISRVLSDVGGRRVILILGGLYVAVAVGQALVHVVGGTPVTEVLVPLLLIGGPGLGLLYGANRLPRFDIRPELYATIVGRCLAGLVVGVAIVSLYQLQPGEGIDHLVRAYLVLTALTALGGFGIGIHDARAETRAREAEQHAREAEQHAQELQQERDLRDRIVDTSPIGIGVIDADGTISFANEHVADILGMPEDDLVGREFDTSIFEATNPAGEPLESTAFEQVLSTGELVYDAERQITRTDGERIWVSVNAAPLRDTAGDMTGVVVATEDITEDKEQKQRLEQQNRRLESFASMLAHELRNPLTIAQIYLQQVGDENPDAVAQVEHSLDRIEEMIDVLLVTARGADSVIDWEEVAVPEVATDAWADVSVDGTDLDVETEQVIRADPVHLHHLFENLFQNSIEHGDTTVTVRVGGLTDGFYVEDTGTGIPEDDRNEVFEAGYTTDGDGIGLGLTFVERLADTYGWDFTLTESETGGARFEFTAVDVVASK